MLGRPMAGLAAIVLTLGGLSGCLRSGSSEPPSTDGLHAWIGREPHVEGTGQGSLVPIGSPYHVGYDYVGREWTDTAWETKRRGHIDKYVFNLSDLAVFRQLRSAPTSVLEKMAAGEGFRGPDLRRLPESTKVPMLVTFLLWRRQGPEAQRSPYWVVYQRLFEPSGGEKPVAWIVKRTDDGDTVGIEALPTSQRSHLAETLESNLPEFLAWEDFRFRVPPVPLDTPVPESILIGSKKAWTFGPSEWVEEVLRPDESQYGPFVLEGVLTRRTPCSTEQSTPVALYFRRVPGIGTMQVDSLSGSSPALSRHWNWWDSWRAERAYSPAQGFLFIKAP